MDRFPRIASLALLTLAALSFTAGCKSNQSAANSGQTAAADNSATGAQDSASDPAAANLAPASATTTPAATSDSDQPAPAPAADTSSDQSSATVTDANYGEQPEYTAPQPPPALPEYDQPPAPGDDYLWTPGYWGYASAGYYWVPGVWVQAPYQGALWTPGYWGWTGGHYGFFHGYWGPHIGFYGGLNYGFGYVGVGYQGGYWNSGHFYYNRSVNNINTTVIHNVYERKVIVNNNVRVSFNGGPGGLQVRPRPAELAAFREPHAPPMKAQLQIRQAASENRANFVTVNHGRPAEAVIAKPVMADRDVHPVAPPAARFEPGHPQPAQPQVRPEARPEARPQARPEARPNPAPPERKVEPAHPATEKPAPRVEPHPQPQVRPKPEEHATPPKPKPEVKPAPKKAPEEKPKPEDEHPR